jgi:hypothetical protein
VMAFPVEAPIHEKVEVLDGLGRSQGAERLCEVALLEELFELVEGCLLLVVRL